MSESDKNLTRRDRLRVTFFAPGMPFDATTVATASLGGSESAAYYLAREVARQGHEVAVFTSHREPKSGDGVTYLYHGDMTQAAPLGDRFEHYATNTPHDLLVAQRSPHIFMKQFAAKVCLWQLHDLALYRTAPAVLGGSWQVDVTTCVSEWHARQVKEVWNINPDTLRVVPNGVDADLYNAPDAIRIIYGGAGISPPMDSIDERRVIGVPNDKFLVLYQSRPERGLDHFLELADRSAGVGLPLHFLYCTYGNRPDHMAAFYDALDARAAGLKNVTRLGALSKPELAALQKRCDLLLYPTEFEEVSCITAMEAMHAGLPMLTSAVGALPETCEGSGTDLLPLKDGKADVDAFFDRLCYYFGFSADTNVYPGPLNDMRNLQHVAKNTRTWERAGDALLAAFDEALAKRQGSPAAVLRHAVEHSDIAFAEWYLERIGGELLKNGEKFPDPIVESVRSEVERLYRFARDPQAYAAHYALHQGAYYDGPGANAAGEDVTRTTRFRGVLQHLAAHINRTKDVSLRVLDYGCAHGHYTVPLAKTFRDCDFVGLDISERAIEQANGWKGRESLDNVEFRVGTQADLEQDKPIGTDALGTFDVIIAGEVLEHVWDYRGLLELFRGRLAPGGVIIVTTPVGRWEHSGTEAFRSAREHLHHFERGDIEDVCAGHEVEVLHAPAGHDRGGFPLSSYCWAVRPRPGLPFFSVDYERKLRRLAPRQTVSACIIARNAEGTLRRCVESFVDWVDEVVIAVDPTTSDGTERVARDVALDFPNRPVRVVPGLSAMSDGFAAARNNSVSHAHGDWILWIDCDEELRHPYAMHRFLKPSMHNGYGWAQVHYSVDPEQVLTTDYPCRLFRNRIGVRFYGFVHEHPETELGKAVPWSLVRPEMKFLHHGYFDEETRQARFRRNLPLLRRDVEAYPTERPLNKFLLLRDTAQAIQFEMHAAGGALPHHAREARRAIELMEQIAEMPQIKMVADSLQYYSLCVSSLGIGFDAELTVKTRHPAAPDLAATFNFHGHFHSSAFYEKLAGKFMKESIKHYDDPHL